MDALAEKDDQVKRPHFVAFGPSVPIVPFRDFSSMPMTREQFADLWWICGPSAARNMLRLELWQVIASAYFEGLLHGAELERERHMSEQSKPVTFTNGLTPEQDDKIDDLMIGLTRIRLEIEGLGRHRAYSLAITKIEEAEHWLQARKHQAA